MDGVKMALYTMVFTVNGAKHIQNIAFQPTISQDAVKKKFSISNPMAKDIRISGVNVFYL